MDTTLKHVAQQICDAVGTGTVDVDASDKNVQMRADGLVATFELSTDKNELKKDGTILRNLPVGRFIYEVTVTMRYESMDE